VLVAYDLEGRQRYRSFNSLEFCNYSLDQLAACRWDELYACEAAVAERIRGFWEQLAEGRAEILFLEDFPEYVVEEIQTPDRARFLVRERCAFRAESALNGQIYIVAIKRIRHA
jgi:hypothetical protein